MSDTSIATLSFEDALKELETIVRHLEEGSLNLKDAMASYERGAILRKHCDALLNEATLKVEQITQNGAGTPVLEPVTFEV